MRSGSSGNRAGRIRLFCATWVVIGTAIHASTSTIAVRARSRSLTSARIASGAGDKEAAPSGLALHTAWRQGQILRAAKDHDSPGSAVAFGFAYRRIHLRAEWLATFARRLRTDRPLVRGCGWELRGEGWPKGAVPGDGCVLQRSSLQPGTDAIASTTPGRSQCCRPTPNSCPAASPSAGGAKIKDGTGGAPLGGRSS
jgi:hypothetical protein